MTRNTNLNQAAINKEDEFYTQLVDVENELRHYKEHFRDKVVYCNCDDPRESAFFHYFSYNFQVLGLKKLITTCYKNQNRDLFSKMDTEDAIYLEYSGENTESLIPTAEEIGIYKLSGDGDFRSDQCIKLLREADIVVTNPPFSLFREYIELLVSEQKSFLIIGNQNNTTYKDVFNYIKIDKIWLGVTNGDMDFRVPDHYTPRDTRYRVDNNGFKWRSFGNICWYTNLEHKKRNEELLLYKTYNSIDYQKYDNYDIINVDKVEHIPIDYKGYMGVPITFLNKYNPNQFSIVGIANSARYIGHECFTIIGGRKVYNRIIIKHNN